MYGLGVLFFHINSHYAPHHPLPWRCRTLFQDFSHEVKHLFRPGVDDDGKLLDRTGVQIAGVEGKHNGINGAGLHAVFGVLGHGALAARVYLANHEFFSAFYFKRKYSFNRIAGIAGAEKDGITSHGL